VVAVNLANWTPVTYASGLIERYQNASAVEAASGRREPMVTDVKKIPKDTDASVQVTQAGETYGLDTQGVGNIQLDAAKLTHASQYNEEDLADAKAWVNATEAKKRNAASNLALLFDNASLAVTGAGDGSNAKPYESVYHNVATNAAANIVTMSAAAFATNSKALNTAINSALAIVEDGAWSSEDLVWIMSPAFKPYLRGMDATGANGQNFYVPSLGGTPGNGNKAILAEYPVHWSRGARLSATATYTPTASTGAKGALGNAIAVLAPARLLIVGDRAPLESAYLDPMTGIGALSDTAYLKMRRRVAFILGEASAAAVVEIIT
jgi:hypothetical protein